MSPPQEAEVVLVTVAGTTSGQFAALRVARADQNAFEHMGIAYLQGDAGQGPSAPERRNRSHETASVT